MKKFKSLCFVLAVLMVVGVMPFGTAMAKENFEVQDFYADNVGSSKDILSKYVDFDSFKSQVRKAVENFETKITVPSKTIPFDSDFMDGVYQLIKYEMCDLFYFYNISIWGSAYVSYIEVRYSYTKAQAESMIVEFDKAVDELTKGIKGNSSLSEAQKALLLHDRLALTCEYDYTYSKRNAYEAIVNGRGVCEGYTLAYSALLDEVGIKSEVCTSDQLNHAWNIVYIGGKPYHVDVTWDDPSWANGERGVLGLVYHDNFLRSTNGIKSTGHDATDFETFPVDTTYDNYFWQTSETSFVLLGGEMYYIDGSSAELKRYSDGAVLCSVYDKWKAGAYSSWSGHFGRLATDGKALYYSLSKTVYKYDVAKGTSEALFSPKLTGLESIYGLEYKNGSLICDLNNAPPFGGGTNLYQVAYILQSETSNETEINIKNGADLFKKGTYAGGVKAGETVSQVLAMLENNDAVVCDEKGKVLSGNALCKTGYSIRLAYDGEIVEALTIFILGDVDGSGSVDSTDYLKIKSAFLGAVSLDGVYFQSADVTSDGKIDTTDYLRIKSYFLGIFDLYA